MWVPRKGGEKRWERYRQRARGTRWGAGAVRERRWGVAAGWEPQPSRAAASVGREGKRRSQARRRQWRRAGGALLGVWVCACHGEERDPRQRVQVQPLILHCAPQGQKQQRKCSFAPGTSVPGKRRWKENRGKTDPAGSETAAGGGEGTGETAGGWPVRSGGGGRVGSAPLAA